MVENLDSGEAHSWGPQNSRYPSMQKRLTPSDVADGQSSGERLTETSYEDNILSIIKQTKSFDYNEDENGNILHTADGRIVEDTSSLVYPIEVDAAPSGYDLDDNVLRRETGEPVGKVYEGLGGSSMNSDRMRRNSPGFRYRELDWKNPAVDKARQDSRDLPLNTQAGVEGKSFLDYLIRSCHSSIDVTPLLMEQMNSVNIDPRDVHNLGQRKAALAEMKKGVVDWSILVSRLESPDTKRMIIDSGQAMRFSETLDSSPQEILGYVKAPFANLYIEFTEPILIGEQEALENADEDLRVGNDYLKSILYWENPKRPDLPEDQLVGANVTFFLVDEEGNSCDRSFGYIIEKNYAITKLISTLTGTDPTVWPKEVLSRTKEKMNADSDGSIDQFYFTGALEPDAWVVAMNSSFLDGTEVVRRYGWWERLVQDYASLLSWLFAYTMAKGLKIAPVELSRAERRRNQKMAEKGQEPILWHTLQVEQRTSMWSSNEEDDELVSGTGRQHTYRYDVMGHLRMGRHKLGDGTYRNTIEWVTPHQRGLKNLNYVPRTRKVVGDMDAKFIPE
jgi:hypothetical protein